MQSNLEQSQIGLRGVFRYDVQRLYEGLNLVEYWFPPWGSTSTLSPLLGGLIFYRANHAIVCIEDDHEGGSQLF